MALEDAKNPIKGVSGPGKYAKRIDRMPSNSYGDTAETAAIASGAPLARSGPTVRLSQAPAVPMEPVTPLYAPSARREEPITAGIDMGAGPGSDVLMINQNADSDEDKQRILSYLPALEVAAAQPDSSQAFRNYVRMLRANLL